MENRFGWGSTPLIHILYDTDIDAPGEGQRLWITDIFIECGDSTSIGLSESGGGEVLVPSVKNMDHTFAAPIKLAENKGVSIDITGVGSTRILIGYYIEGVSHN